jgi:integrase
VTQVIGDLRTEGKRKGRPVGQSDDLTAEELQHMMTLPDRRSKQGARDYAVLITFGNTAMRKGEMVSLNTENLVDQGEKKYIDYKALKKRSDQPFWVRVPISNKVYDGIKRYSDLDHQRTPSSPLFRTLGKHGPYEPGRITPAAIDLIIQKYVDQAGIRKRITPHSFRATFPTLRKHHDPWTLQKLGGWGSVTSVMPYVRETEKEMEEAALEFQFS